MTRVHVEVLGDVVFSRRLLRAAVNGADLSNPYETIFDQFDQWWDEQFATAGAALGTPWEPLADSTIESKEAAGYAEPATPLVATGALRGSGGSVRRVGPEDAEWGTDDPNAMWHHGRARSSRNPVPRRPLFELDEVRRRWAMGVMHRHVFETGALR